MKITRLILVVLIACVLVEAKKRHKHRGRKEKFDNVFDLAKFLGRVLDNTNTKKTSGALTSGPAVGAIGTGPAVGSMQVGSVAAQAEECRDLASWCANYKKNCDHSTVKKYCKKTCNTCPVPVKKDCKDEHTSCATGVKWGYCNGRENEVNFMKKYCKKSCNFCTEKPDCVNTQGDQYCESIRKNGYCPKPQYRTFLEKNCRKSCGFCGATTTTTTAKPTTTTTPFTCGVAKRRSKDGSGIIVGGVGSKKGFFPWQVAIYYDNKFMCGGTLVSTKHVLTAAHCFKYRSNDTSRYHVMLGEHNRKYNEGTEQKVNVDKITVNENYENDEDEHDIALIKLVEEAKLSDYISPVCLPNVFEVLKAGTQCYITGWGKKQFDGEAVDILQQVKVPVVDRSVCEVRNTFNFHKVTNRMVCTGFDDGSTFISGCHGDSGGPLSCETRKGVWTVYGVVSWGSPLCNGLDRYTVFARVSAYKSWIEKHY